MTCEHRYVPFPGSRRNLYCEFCGQGRDAFVRTERVPARRASSSGVRSSAAPARDVQPTLFDAVDPEADAASDVLAQRRAMRDLETRTRAIIAEQNPDLSGDEVDDLVRQVLDFGPAVDLDAFAEQVAATAPRERRRPVDENDDALGRGAEL